MTRRDCTCPRARHEHGHWHAYANDKCRCQPCRDAWAVYHRRCRKIREHYYRGQPMRATVTGTARRLQALAANGWSNHDIARQLNTTPYVVWDWQHGRGEWIKPANVARVAAVYDQIWDKPPPGRYAVKIRNLAAKKGWLPPMAWDDDEIDNPTARPFRTRDRAPVQPHGTTAAYKRHIRHGEQPCDECRASESARRTEWRRRKAAA